MAKKVIKTRKNMAEIKQAVFEYLESTIKDDE